MNLPQRNTIERPITIRKIGRPKQYTPEQEEEIKRLRQEKIREYKRKYYQEHKEEHARRGRTNYLKATENHVYMRCTKHSTKPKDMQDNEIYT